MDYMYYCLAFFLSSFLVFKLVFQRSRNLPPSPFGFPIIGHLHLVTKPPMHKVLAILSNKCGPIFTLKLGSKNIVVVCSLSAAEECFLKNDIVFANRPQSIFFHYWSYNYAAFLFAPYGHLWRTLRRFSVTELFSRSCLDRSTAITEEIRTLLRLILSKVSDDGAKKVDLKYFFTITSLNVIMKMIAGKKWVEEEKAACLDSGKQCLEDVQKIFPSNTGTILKWVGYKVEEESVIKVFKERDEFLQGLIEEVKRKETSSVTSNPAEGVKDQITVIGSLLALQKSDPELYTDEVVKGTMATLYLAGVDTVDFTTEWAMTFLLNHPERLERVKAEIDREVGHELLVQESDLPKLRYLRCVVNETLRLYPPAPLLLPHAPSEDCIIGGYEIPRGTIVMVNAWAIHRDPKLWEDPESFKPERFEGLNNEGEKQGFIPFGIGRRACPGNHMAMRRVMLALAALIQCFEWERVGQELIDMSIVKALISVQKAKPLEAICTPRPFTTSLISPP
uniref:Cytochrome P450 family protein n=2 Tax=Populus TaxID=3689 RepID=A0A4U5QCM0_POPAL|nr:cytochrome P450 family protein [Populus alba]